MSRDFKFKVLYPAIGGIITMVLVLLVQTFSFVEDFENYFLDMKYSVSPKSIEETKVQEGVTKIDRELETDIMILGIDEESVGLTDTLGKFPWPRSVYSELISYFYVSEDTLKEYDEMIDETKEIIGKIKSDAKKTEKSIKNGLKNDLFLKIDLLNHAALKYYSKKDIKKYEELESANLGLISRLAYNNKNKTILGEVTYLTQMVLNDIHPREEEKLEYFMSIYSLIEELNKYLLYTSNDIASKLSNETIESSQKTELEKKKHITEENILFLNKFLDPLNNYIKYLDKINTKETELEIIKDSMLIYLVDNLKYKPDSEIEDNEDFNKLIEKYFKIILNSSSKTISKVNEEIINNMAEQEEEAINIQLNIININEDIIKILLMNDENIEILEDTKIVSSFVLINLKPTRRRADLIVYYKDLHKLLKLMIDYIKTSGQNSELLEEIEIFSNEIDVLRYYSQKQYELKDILQWNKEDINILMDYNKGDIKPNMLFFDIFIDQPGETKIYELSTKKSFYKLLKDEVNIVQGFDNYNYDVFTGTIEKVRKLSDEKLFATLKKHKDDSVIFWDYFGQYVAEGRVPVAELVKRLKAIEPWKITDNVKNPEVAKDNMSTLRDLKVPLVEISRNSKGIGAAIVEEDSDGKLRRMPLIIKFYDERVDRTKKNQPIMEKPEFYMGIDLVLAMEYFNVKKADLEIILGDKIILKHASIPKKVKISHEYVDGFGSSQSREYYFNYNDIKQAFKNAISFPEFTTIKIFHYENQKIKEDGKTNLASILPFFQDPNEELREIKYRSIDGQEISIGDLSSKYIYVDYGKIYFKASQLKNKIRDLLGETDTNLVNIVFSHWENIDKSNKKLIEDGRTTLSNILSLADPTFGFMEISFNDSEKGDVKIDDLENTEIEISKAGGSKLRLSVKEFIDFLSSDVNFSIIEYDGEKETPKVYSIPLYNLLNNDLTNIILEDDKKGSFVLKDLENVEVSITKTNTEQYKFKATKFLNILYPEPKIEDVSIPIDETGKFIINFQGSANTTYETYPIYYIYSEALSKKGDPGRANWSSYKNRVLLAGIYSSAGINIEGRKDTFNTPFDTMYGIEVHANALYTIFNQDFIKFITGWGVLFIQIGILLFLVLVLPRISILNGAIIEILMLILIFVEALTLFAVFKINVPIIPQLSIAMTGFVALTVVKLLSEEKEKGLVRKMFSTYVNVEVVNELLKDPEHALQLGGLNKTITCFFSDIRGYTALSEKLKKVSDAELITRINEYFSIMTDIVLKYKGTLDKYMGDAIMAFWGAPIEYDKHALLACKTAIEMLEQLPALKEQWPENLRNFDIGIGINTGPAIAGNTGSDLRKNYTILGDTVNLGSRLEGVNKEYKTRIIISEYTYEEVKDYVIVRELDLIIVKGKTEPVRIYELLGLNEEGENYHIGDVKMKFSNK